MKHISRRNRIWSTDIVVDDRYAERFAELRPLAAHQMHRPIREPVGKPLMLGQLLVVHPHPSPAPRPPLPDRFPLSPPPPPAPRALTVFSSRSTACPARSSGTWSNARTTPAQSGG